MLGGFTLASVSIGWSDGTYANIIEMFTRNQLGHIQIHEGDYLDRPSLYKNIDDYRKIGEKISGIPHVEAWAPRLYSFGLVSAGKKSATVKIIGIDPDLERRAVNFEKKVVQGRFFSGDGSREVLIGETLARVLKVSPGDEIVIVSQAADGSIANDAYRLAGLVRTGDEITDRSAFYLELDEAQELLALEGKVHEIIVIADDADRVPSLTSRIRKTLESTGLEVSPWTEFAASFYRTMKADQQGMWISLLLILVLVAVGVLNTVLMSVLERRREYGVLKAIGMRPWQLVRLVIYEVNIMALGSILIGAGLSALANYLLSLHGIHLPRSFTYGGVRFDTMYSELNIRSFTIPAVTVLMAATLVALLPAIRAAGTRPAKAMRMH